mgnify:CR=1 FL=1
MRTSIEVCIYDLPSCVLCCFQHLAPYIYVCFAGSVLYDKKSGLFPGRKVDRSLWFLHLDQFRVGDLSLIGFALYGTIVSLCLDRTYVVAQVPSRAQRSCGCLGAACWLVWFILRVYRVVPVCSGRHLAIDSLGRTGLRVVEPKQAPDVDALVRRSRSNAVRGIRAVCICFKIVVCSFRHNKNGTLVTSLAPVFICLVFRPLTTGSVCTTLRLR